MEPDADEDPVYPHAPGRFRRPPVTGVRNTLSGYQNGRCAYCDTEFTSISTSRVAVDHVVPLFSWPTAGGTGTCTRCEFEVSVDPVKGETPWRKALEATVSTLCRLHAWQSPYVNFGRMPPGYRNSTGNNSRLVESGKRALGGPDPSAAVSAPSVPVNGDPLGDPESLDWMGWAWSDWVPLADTLGAVDSVGLYRVRNEEVPGLVYVGQGKIPARLAIHLRKGYSPDHRQAAYFSYKVTASWLSLPNVPVVNLLETRK